MAWPSQASKRLGSLAAAWASSAFSTLVRLSMSETAATEKPVSSLHLQLPFAACPAAQRPMLAQRCMQVARNLDAF